MSIRSHIAASVADGFCRYPCHLNAGDRPGRLVTAPIDKEAAKRLKKARKAFDAYCKERTKNAQT